ncbi:unnamed protein product [Alopecurus aequalis]
MQRISPTTLGDAVQSIIPYLEDTRNPVYRAIYWEGWSGLAASAVLRAIARDPPPSLRDKFNEIIHVDCSRWKSRRELQRTIARELKLPHRVMNVFDRQDEEDDFRGVDESSRAEIESVGREIFRAIMGLRCLVVFHNGSNGMVDLIDFGIPPLEFFDVKLLWTFEGRLRLKQKISEKVDDSHLYLYEHYSEARSDVSLQIEARELSGYIDDTPDEAVVEQCCMYLLSLNSQASKIRDYKWSTHASNYSVITGYKWATHASNYWVCDGIIEGGQADKAWEVAAALHEQIHIEDYSSYEGPASNALYGFDDLLYTPLKKRWTLVSDLPYCQRGLGRGLPLDWENSVVHGELTSLFLAASGSLHDGLFHRADKLRVLNLCGCTFSFSSPPFRRCSRLRFLGLDGCKDQQKQDEEDDTQGKPAMLFFHSLWVLDICNTDWDLPDTVIDQMATNIREVHVKKGRIWSSGFSWRRLENLRKLRVIAPTCTWETSQRDEFADMVKIEFIDLSGNSTIHVLPSLLGATSLTTMVLDGCVGLEHVGPEGLPPLLESFSLDAQTSGDQNEEAKISRISLAGCARLAKFRLCGPVPNLEELDLSGTLVKTLDLKDQVVYAPSLQRIVLLGCLQLHAILWPRKGLPKLMVLHIDSLACRVRTQLHQAYATILDMRFFQTLVLESNLDFCWKSTRSHLNLCIPCTDKVVEEESNEKMTGHGSSGQLIGPPRPKLLIPNNCSAYIDVYTETMTTGQDYNSSPQLKLSGCHVEIGEGISDISVESLQGMNAIMFVINKAVSLHVHDNSSITTVVPENNMISAKREVITWKHLQQCYVVRCPKMQIVFTRNFDHYWFQEIETFWAANLLMAHCIWSKGRMASYFFDTTPFAKLRSIHLYFCPRLTFVLPFTWDCSGSFLPNLETLHIVNCGDLKEVFPVELISINYEGVLWYPNLRHIYLHELYKLQHICEAKMIAPRLETVRLRGCWGLRRLPAVGRGNRRRPVVECEKDWWENLEWDGLEDGHHPVLFEPHHSSYYKKPLPRVSVLR